eukprot:765239-Hanusia_phi.AAC.4
MPNTIDVGRTIQQATGITVSLWGYMTSSSGNFAVLMDFGGPLDVNAPRWQIGRDGTANQLWISTSPSGGPVVCGISGPYANNFLIWLDGVLVCRMCKSGFIGIIANAADRQLRLGKQWGSGNGKTQGGIDDFRIYSYPFTQFDMEQHYLPLFNPTACLPDSYNPNGAYAFYPDPTLIASKNFPGITDPNNGAVAPIAAWDDAFRDRVAADKYATIVRVCYDCAAENWLTMYKRVLPVDADWSISTSYLTSWVTDRNTEDFAYIRFTYAGSGTSTTYTVIVTSDIIVDILIVGGGGAGGGRQGAGGGGGGVMYRTNQRLVAGTYTVIVGKGGVGNTAPGGNGYASSFGSYTAYGGGGGAGFSAHALSYNMETNLIASGGGGRGWGASASDNGYSNGGTSNGNVLLTQNGGVGNNGGRGWQNYGGDAATTNTIYALLGGGGGGAGGVGQDATPTSNVAPTYVGKGGDGGPGTEVNIIGGTGNYYGGDGGGGGGGWSVSGDLTGDGGIGGGGAGRNNAVGVAGTAHTGGGGGGGGYANQNGGAGGSGVVILRYSTTVVATSANDAVDSTKKAAYYLLSDCVKCAEGFQTGVTTATSSAECKWFDFSAVGSYSADGFSQALTGTASASSTFSGFSSTVVLSDTTTWGEPDSNFWSSTNVASQWWSVDFGLVQSVRFVRVWTRMDSPTALTRGSHQALVGNSTTVTDNRRCGIYQRFSTIYMTTTSTCDQYGSKGYIYQSDSTNAWLHLGRVRFYGGCTPCPDGTTTIGEGRADVAAREPREPLLCEWADAGGAGGLAGGIHYGAVRVEGCGERPRLDGDLRSGYSSTTAVVDQKLYVDLYVSAFSVFPSETVSRIGCKVYVGNSSGDIGQVTLCNTIPNDKTDRYRERERRTGVQSEVKVYTTEICPEGTTSGIASTRCSQGVYCPGGTGSRGSVDHAWDLTTVFGDGLATCNPGSSFSGSAFTLGLTYIYVFDTACTRIFRIHQATWRYEPFTPTFTPTVTLVANTVLLADMATDGVYIALEDCIYYSDSAGNAVLRYGYCGQKGLGSGVDSGVGTDARFNRISVMVWSVDSQILLVDYTMDNLKRINVSTDDVTVLLTDCCPSSKPPLGLSQDYTGQDILRLIGCHDANRIVVWN